MSFNISSCSINTYVVNFSPLTAGSYNGNVIIDSNAENDHLVNLQVTGSAYLPPAIEVSTNALTATLIAGTEIDQPFTIANTGGLPLFYYIAPSEGSRLTKEFTREDKSIAGSTLSLNYADYEPGETLDWTFSLYNNSPDNEWLEDVYITFPDGIIVNSATNFTCGTAAMIPDLTSGNGITIHWHGETSGGWGVIHGGETATAIVNVSIPFTINGGLILSYTIQGEVFGSEPHQLNDQIVLSHIVTTIPWLTI